MTEAENKASAIYGLICVTAPERPRSADSLDQMLRSERQWKDANPALILLQESEAEVLLAFLVHSLEWLGEQRLELSQMAISLTIADGIRIALKRLGTLTDEASILEILRRYRKGNVMARMSFPFAQFLSVLNGVPITPDLREEFRRLHAEFAPSPTGKIDPANLQIRNRLAELMHTEGEKHIDSGRGPWSQIVFDQLQDIEPISRAAWLGLLEHCQSVEQTVPGVKWKKRATEIIRALGQTKVRELLCAWLRLGPTPGQPLEARSPIEDSAYQKGLVWCLSLDTNRDSAVAIGDFAFGCLRKIRMTGAVSQKVGFACVQALGEMDCAEAIVQLSRLRAKIRYAVALRLIDKSLRAAAERKGMTTEDLEDLSTPSYDLNSQGEFTTAIEEYRAVIRLDGESRATVNWHDHLGKHLKTLPATLRKKYPAEVRAVSARAKELQEVCQAQRVRLEGSLIRPRKMTAEHWRNFFIEHPLLGHLGRRLIWIFGNASGWEQSGIWESADVRDADGEALDLSAAETVQLWHPLSSTNQEIHAWRKRISAAGVQQPFPQATRETYRLTDGERTTKLYSNRFAGKVLRQHQLASLCRERGWKYRLMSAKFDGFNVPTKELPAWKMHAEFYVDLLEDRDPALRDSGLGEESATGIAILVGSDQVRFYRNEQGIALDEVPALVYSEVMRDVDLFSTVCAIGDDASWSDLGDRGHGMLSGKFDLKESLSLVKQRAEILRLVLRATSISDRCSVGQHFLEVRGQMGTYRIALLWGGVALLGESHPHWITVPQKDLEAVPLDVSALPVRLDYRTESILRKALYFADDWKITSPEVIEQLAPK